MFNLGTYKILFYKVVTNFGRDQFDTYFWNSPPPVYFWLSNKLSVTVAQLVGRWTRDRNFPSSRPDGGTILRGRPLFGGHIKS